MKGLLLDTSTSQAIVGLADEAKLVELHLLPSGRNLSSGLFPAIEPLCKQLDYIAVGVGPGSYMGVRTGATVAKLLAFSKKIPLVEFSSLLVSIPEEVDGPFLFVGDAKMGELFLVEGEIQQGRATVTSQLKLIPAAGAEEHLKPEQTLVDSTSSTPHFKWALAHTLEALDKKKTTAPKELALSYLR